MSNHWLVWIHWINEAKTVVLQNIVLYEYNLKERSSACKRWRQCKLVPRSDSHINTGDPLIFSESVSLKAILLLRTVHEINDSFHLFCWIYMVSTFGCLLSLIWSLRTLYATAYVSAEESVFGALQRERFALLKNCIAGNGQSRGATRSLRLANEMHTSGRWQTYSATWWRQRIPCPTNMTASWKLLNLLRHRNENSGSACNGTDETSCCLHARCVIVQLFCSFQSI